MDDRLRRELVSFAGGQLFRRGLPPDEAEDLAQEALRSITERKPDSPRAYGMQVVRNLAAAAHRRWCRTTLLDDGAMDLELAARVPPVEETEADRWLTVIAALEQHILYDRHPPRGRTRVVVPSLVGLDLEPLRLRVRFFARLIHELPLAKRHQSRMMEDLIGGIVDAYSRAGYLVGDPCQHEDLERLRMYRESDPVPDEDGHDPRACPPGHTPVSPLVLRGYRLALLASVTVDPEDALEAAERAERAVFGADGASLDRAAAEALVFARERGDCTASAWERRDLADALLQLQTDPLQEFAIFHGDIERNVFIQFHVDGDDLLAEAVGSRFLAPGHQLAPERVDLLLAAGWDGPDRRMPNFYREWSASTDTERLAIAAAVLRLFREVYGCDPGQKVWIEIVGAVGREVARAV